MCKLSLALDHPNYASLLPVHLLEMVMLQDNAPEVEKEFQNGKFVAKNLIIDFINSIRSGTWAEQ